MQSAPPGVVDRGAVLLQLAGELAERGRHRFQGAVLAEPGGEGSQPAGLEGLQAEELLGGAVVLRAGDRDGEHDGERCPVAEEVEALGRHQAQRPAWPKERRQGCGEFPGAGGRGDAGRAGEGAVAELAEGVQPGRQRLGQGGLQGGAGLVPVDEDVRRAGGVAAAGGVAGEPGGDDRVGIAVPAVQHDVRDRDAERGDRRELPAVLADRAGRHAGARASFVKGGDGGWPAVEFAQDRGGRGREGGRPVHGRDGSTGDRVEVVQLLLRGGCFRWPVS